MENKTVEKNDGENKKDLNNIINQAKFSLHFIRRLSNEEEIRCFDYCWATTCLILSWLILYLSCEGSPLSIPFVLNHFMIEASTFSLSWIEVSSSEEA